MMTSLQSWRPVYNHCGKLAMMVASLDSWRLFAIIVDPFAKHNGQSAIIVANWQLWWQVCNHGVQLNNPGSQFAIRMAVLNYCGEYDSWCLLAIMVVRLKILGASLQSFWPVCYHGDLLAITVSNLHSCGQYAVMLASLEP